MEIWQNGTLMMQVNKTAHAGCYFGGYTGSGPQTCGNLNGSDDFTQLPLWIGGDWGAIVPTITYDDTKHRMMCTGGTYNGNAVTADEACPPSGYIPYWHNYITDVIVMVPQ
jgi:hypothetical protein